MSLSRRFWLTLAAVFAIAIGSGGGWALAQEREGQGTESTAVEPSGDDSAPTGESEGETSAAEPAGDDSTSGEAEAATATESEASFTG